MNLAIAYTESVAIQLSNFCNLATFHEKCPLHLQWSSPFCVDQPTMLPTQIVMHLLDTLAKWNYAGDIGFSIYNEPLMDPRLCHFVYTAKTTIPEAQITIWTNGVFLTREFAEELHELGVHQLVISPYENVVSFLERFRGLSYVTFTSGLLDGRLTLYTRKINNHGKPCGAPLRQVVINCHGHVGLCCMDWKWSRTFGDLRTESLEQILTKLEVLQLYNKLQLGIRDDYPCCHCQHTR